MDFRIFVKTKNDKYMIQRIIFFLFLIVTATSCNKDRIFEKNHDFNNNTWSKTEIVTFEADIEDVESEYDIYLSVRNASFYPFANVIMGLTIETPAGESRMMQHELMVKNTDGSFRGEGLGDIYDISIPVFKNMLFKDKGKYKFIIDNRMHLVEMPGIMSVGLIIQKSKKSD